ncbi:MAG: DNA-binding protein, partial [Bacteroidaceae bacterium]|nr:DNA-binding protein [Bacteroidaceae bacterium]
LAGNSVSLGELGKFHVELNCEPAVTTEDFTAANIKAVNVCWTPGEDFKDMKKDAEFQLVPSRKLAADAIEVIKNTDTIQGLE